MSGAPGGAPDGGWTYVPGLLQLVEQGVEPADLGSRDFMAPQVRSTPRDGPLTAHERGTLERLWDWLRGFRAAGVVVEHLPVWAPVAQVWPATGTTATFTYSAAAEGESSAELTVVAVGGFGGGSRRTLTHEVQLDVAGGGVVHETLVHVAVHRYVHRTSGQEIDCVDVDASGETDEFRSRDLPWEQHPFHGRTPTQAEVARDHAVERVAHLRDHAGTATVTLRDEKLRMWHFDAGGESPAGALKLSATCRNTRAFETVFSLPGGRDYAFVAPRAEAPVVPVCVALAEG